MKRIGLGLAVVAAALVALVLIVPWLTPESVVRDAVRRSIVAMTGREPVIEGPVRLSLAPLPTITTGRITIPGLPGGVPLLDTAQLEGTLRLFSLVSGKIEISSLALDNPRLSLVATVHGDHSWDFRAGALADAAAGHIDAVLPIKSLRLINGIVNYSDTTNGQNTVVTMPDTTFNWSSLTDTMSASGVIEWRHRSSDISVSISDPASLISGGMSEVRVKMKSDLLDLSATGNLAGYGKFDGKIAASGGSLRDTLRWVGLDLPEGHSLAEFDVQSPITIDAAGVALGDVQLDLDGNQAEGALTVQLSGPRPKVSGTLAADTLNLTPYSSEVQLSGDQPHPWRNDRISLKGLVVSDLDIRISSAETIVNNATLGRMAAAISSHDGLLDIALGEAAAYGGTLKGRVTLKMAPTGTEFAASGTFDSVEMGTGLGDFLGFHKLEGVGSGSVDLSASGVSVADLSRTLEGQASVKIANGALVGIDLNDLMQKVEKRPLSARLDASYGGRTAFDKASASFKIVQGVATTQDALLANANLSVTLTGQSNIASRSLDMTGLASWTDSEGADPLKLPFRIYGAWNVPVIEPDTEALIRRSGAAAPLLRDLLKPAQDATQEVPSTPASLTP